MSLNQSHKYCRFHELVTSWVWAWQKWVCEYRCLRGHTYGEKIVIFHSKLIERFMLPWRQFSQIPINTEKANNRYLHRNEIYTGKVFYSILLLGRILETTIYKTNKRRSRKLMLEIPLWPNMCNGNDSWRTAILKAQEKKCR